MSRVPVLTCKACSDRGRITSSIAVGYGFDDIWALNIWSWLHRECDKEKKKNGGSK